MSHLPGRADHLALRVPTLVYQALAALQPGEPVPPQVYVADYATDEIPGWRVHSRTALDADVVELVVFDMSNTYIPGQPVNTNATDLTWNSLFAGDTAVDVQRRYPAARIFTSPAKTLRSPIVEYNGAWPRMLCDMLQQAKYLHGKRRPA